MIQVVLGDSLKILRFKLVKIDQTTGIKTASDLTSCTAQIKYSINEGTEKVKNLEIQEPETSGIVDLPAASDNFDAVGIAVGRIYVTSSGKIGPTYKATWRVVSP